MMVGRTMCRSQTERLVPSRHGSCSCILSHPGSLWWHRASHAAAGLPGGWVLYEGGMLMASQPQEIAPGVFYIEAGKGIPRSNVYFVRSGSSWVLIDTASAHCGPVIQKAAESLFGADTPPVAILLTHVHPDHSGSTLELARRWGCLAYVYPDELPFATADISNFFSTYKDYTTSVGPLDPPPLTGGSSCRWCALCRGGGVRRCLRSRVSGTSHARLIPDWSPRPCGLGVHSHAGTHTGPRFLLPAQ